jgi:hypothetical protein
MGTTYTLSLSMHFRQQPEEANADGLRTAHAATAMAFSQCTTVEYLNHNIIGIHIYVRIITSDEPIAYFQSAMPLPHNHYAYII